MASNEFTSGPLRDFSSIEAGTFGFSDIELLSDSGHNNVYRAKMSGKWVVLKTAKQEEGAFTRNQLLFLPRSITNPLNYQFTQLPTTPITTQVPVNYERIT